MTDNLTYLTDVRETSAAIGQQAAEWAIRLDHGPLTVTDQAEFDAWLARSIRHVGAFARAEAVLQETQRLKALGPAALHMQQGINDDEEHEVDRQGWLSRRKMLGAAVLAAGIPAGLWITAGGGKAYATELGEVRSIALPDGSRMTMNTASSALVWLTGTESRVELRDGEVLFDIAKGSGRPFTVVAGSALVQATGTSFAIKRIDGAPVELLVRAGVVRLSRVGGGRSAQLVSANMRVLGAGTDLGQVRNIGPAAVHRELAWREGMLSFEDEMLDNVANQFRRYSEIPIVFSEPSVARETITGTFTANDPRGFAEAASLALGLKAQASDQVIILHR